LQARITAYDKILQNALFRLADYTALFQIRGRADEEEDEE